ncbi:hypothetical protein MTO96_037782, partial [Rhipicephalus appendiculatus]
MPRSPAAPKTKPACAAARTEPATVDNEPSGNLQVSGLANTTQALFCEHEPGSTLCESRDKAEVAMAAATKTTAAAKKAKSPTAKLRPAAARSPSWTIHGITGGTDVSGKARIDGGPKPRVTLWKTTK